MAKTTNIVYRCDMCDKELPDNYKNTDGEGGSYFLWDVYNEVPLSPPVKDCVAARVKVTLGGKKDERRYTDLCNACKLKILRKAVAFYEATETEPEEPAKEDEQIPGQLSIDDLDMEGGATDEGKEANV